MGTVVMSRGNVIVYFDLLNESLRIPRRNISNEGRGKMAASDFGSQCVYETVD